MEGVPFASSKARAIILVPLVILLVFSTFLAVGYAASIVFGIPLNAGYPVAVRLVGLLLLVSGFLFLGWLFRYRKPVDVLHSTYVTFLKAGRRKRLDEQMPRTEPLVIAGPYRYVRHPLYFAVVVLMLGWGLLLDYSPLILSTPFLLAWFYLVVTRFEEVELRAMFAARYEEYAREVPRMIPLPRYRRKENRLRE